MYYIVREIGNKLQRKKKASRYNIITIVPV